MINKNVIGRIIKTARIKNDLTQEELAETVEISSNYLSKVERGLNMPGADVLLKIAERTGLKMEDFGILQSRYEQPVILEIGNILSNCDKKTYKLILEVVKTIVTEMRKAKI